jgi:hypothetical protein
MATPFPRIAANYTTISIASVEKRDGWIVETTQSVLFFFLTFATYFGAVTIVSVGYEQNDTSWICASLNIWESGNIGA